MNEIERFQQAIQYIKKEIGQNQKTIANTLKIQEGSLTDILKGRVKSISPRLAELLEIKYNISQDFIYCKSDEMMLKAVTTPVTRFKEAIDYILENVTYISEADFTMDIGATPSELMEMYEAGETPYDVLTNLKVKHKISDDYILNGIGNLLLGDLSTGDDLKEARDFATKIMRKPRGKEILELLSHIKNEDIEFVIQFLKKASH